MKLHYPPDNALSWVVYSIFLIGCVWFGIYIDGLYHALRWGH